MINLQQIESDMVAAMKAKDATATQTLRALKTRIQNKIVEKMSAEVGSASGGRDLSEEEIISLIKSEVKRRKEAAEAFKAGGREDQAGQEIAESAILEKYLPEQMSEQQIAAAIDEALAGQQFSAAEFGKAMGAVKAKVGSNADGALVARILKEKLK
jgi:uncharacterized protein